MKKSIFLFVFTLMFYPFMHAQTPNLLLQFYTQNCDTTYNLEASAGCNYWVIDGNADTIFQDAVPASLANWTANINYNPANAPYHVAFDSICLVSNGTAINQYNFPVTNVSSGGGSYTADSIFVCPVNTQPQGMLFTQITTFNCTSSNNFSAASGCNYYLVNSNEDTIYQATIPQNTAFWSFNMPYDGSNMPYALKFDSTCLVSNGVNLNEYNFPITGAGASGNNLYDSIVVCPANANPSINYSLTMLTDSCNGLPMGDNSKATGCNYWIEDANGNTIYQTGIQNTGTNNLLGFISFPFDSSEAPYSLHFFQGCLEANGIIFNNYTFALDNSVVQGNTIADTITICTHSDTTGNNSCVDLYSYTSPWIGYYQNQINDIRFTMGNNSNSTQSVHVEITMPNGVTPVLSSFDFPYTVSGNTLKLDETFPPYTSYSDIIEFNVPGGISSGTLHVYGISINNNDSTAVECTAWDNQDSLSQVVGNSYDPNAKTVSLQKEIAVGTQDEFIYTIYFQNTGTAPAQDIYILDTLSNNLDWSTFQFLRASDVVGISDVGNGVKKFQFDDIWLPDSTTDFAGSQGFVSFKIKEKPGNLAGSEISNTAYIYFDQNAPIVTNTTYNINVEHLGLNNLSKHFGVKLFPNPANSSIKIEGSSPIEKLEIYATDGKLCWSSNPGQPTVKLDVSKFEKGLYIVKVQSQNNMKTLRFIKR